MPIVNGASSTHIPTPPRRNERQPPAPSRTPTAEVGKQMQTMDNRASAPRQPQASSSSQASPVDKMVTSMFGMKISPSFVNTIRNSMDEMCQSAKKQHRDALFEVCDNMILTTRQIQKYSSDKGNVILDSFHATYGFMGQEFLSEITSTLTRDFSENLDLGIALQEIAVNKRIAQLKEHVHTFQNALEEQLKPLENRICRNDDEIQAATNDGASIVASVLTGILNDAPELDIDNARHEIIHVATKRLADMRDHLENTTRVNTEHPKGGAHDQKKRDDMPSKMQAAVTAKVNEVIENHKQAVATPIRASGSVNAGSSAPPPATTNARSTPVQGNVKHEANTAHSNMPAPSATTKRLHDLAVKLYKEMTKPLLAGRHSWADRQTFSDKVRTLICKEMAETLKQFITDEQQIQSVLIHVDAALEVEYSKMKSQAEDKINKNVQAQLQDDMRGVTDATALPSPDEVIQEYKRALQPLADDPVNVLTEKQFALHSEARYNRAMARYNAIGKHLVDDEKISTEELATKRSAMEEQLQNARTVMLSYHRGKLPQPEQAPTTGTRAPQDEHANMRQAPPLTDSRQPRAKFEAMTPIKAITSLRVAGFMTRLEDIEARLERKEIVIDDTGEEALDSAVAEFSKIPAADRTQMTTALVEAFTDAMAASRERMRPERIYSERQRTNMKQQMRTALYERIGRAP